MIKPINKRVVITGLGLVTPLGIGVKPTWESLCAGKSGVGEITRFDSSAYATKIAAEIKDFDAGALFGRRAARRNDRFTLFALHAAREAIADAELDCDNGAGQHIGVFIGTAIGGILTLLKNWKM